jgi:hypothetical protein
MRKDAASRLVELWDNERSNLGRMDMAAQRDFKRLYLHWAKGTDVEAAFVRIMKWEGIIPPDSEYQILAAAIDMLRGMSHGDGMMRESLRKEMGKLYEETVSAIEQRYVSPHQAMDLGRQFAELRRALGDGDGF